MNFVFDIYSAQKSNNQHAVYLGVPQYENKLMHLLNIIIQMPKNAA